MKTIHAQSQLGAGCAKLLAPSRSAPLRQPSRGSAVAAPRRSIIRFKQDSSESNQSTFSPKLPLSGIPADDQQVQVFESTEDEPLPSETADNATAARSTPAAAAGPSRPAAAAGPTDVPRPLSPTQAPSASPATGTGSPNSMLAPHVGDGSQPGLALPAAKPPSALLTPPPGLQADHMKPEARMQTSPALSHDRFAAAAADKRGPPTQPPQLYGSVMAAQGAISSSFAQSGYQADHLKPEAHMQASPALSHDRTANSQLPQLPRMQGGATSAQGAGGSPSPQSGAARPARDVPGPQVRPPPMGKPIPSPASYAYGLLGLGWLALACSLAAAPDQALKFLFPSAVHQPGARLLAALWGASLLPLAVAALNIKGALDAGMMGTSGPDQLNGVVSVGCALIAGVAVQALSLRHPPFNVILGFLAGGGLALSLWLASAAHRWSKAPLPNISSLVSSILSTFTFPPRSWASLAYTCISAGLIGTGIALMRASSVNAPAVLLGGLEATGLPPASSLAIFVGRATGGALVASGLLSGILGAAAERLLLPARTAQQLNLGLAFSSFLMATLIGLGMGVGTVAVTPSLLALLAGQVAVGAWSISAAFTPASLVGDSLVPSGSDKETRAPAAKVTPARMSTQEFWQAMTQGPPGQPEY